MLRIFCATKRPFARFVLMPGKTPTPPMNMQPPDRGKDIALPMSLWTSAAGLKLPLQQDAAASALARKRALSLQREALHGRNPVKR